MSDIAPSPHPGMGFKQFVALIAAMMATNALAIDSMLPALPRIGEALGVHDPNARQWVITSYLLGFGVAQLAYGSLADRYGRKPVLLVGLTLYTIFAALCAFATSFETLLAARFLTGLGAASTRVLSVSIVRDCYAGRQMARVMSLAFIVFLATPIIAPSLGQGIMLFASWRWIFGVLSIFGLVVMAWAAVKLPETQHPEDRIPISVAGVTSAFRIALTDRIAMGYTIAAALVLSGLFGFLNSAQQVFAEVLGAGDAGFDASDIFSSLFGEGSRRARGKPEPQKPPEQSFTLDVTLAQAATGGTRRVKLPGGREVDVVRYRWEQPAALL